MSYIGVEPKSGFIKADQEKITGQTTNYVNLTNSISTLDDVQIWVNYVIQDPSTLTLNSTTQVGLGDTLVSSDVVLVTYLGQSVATQSPPVGGVTNDMLSGSIANSKLANSSITLNGSSVSLGGSITGIGEANTPSFSVRLSSDQSVANQTTTKLALATEDWDTDSAWNTSNHNFTVPSGQAGKYYFTGHVIIGQIAGHDSTLYFSQLQIRKNDSNVAEGRTYDFSATTKNLYVTINKMLDLSVGDVVDFRVYHNGSGQTNQNIYSGQQQTWFQGFKVTT